MDPILVTGGAGFIGSHTCKALAGHGFMPVAFDNLTRGHADAVRWGPLVRGDMLDPVSLDEAFVKYRPVAVIHFAALAYVGESIEQPLAYYKTNIGGLLNLLEAMCRHQVATMVFSSTCATYGIPDVLPIPEFAPQKPINPYGRSKLACEQIIVDMAKISQLRFALLRYFNACGADPDGELTERHIPETHIIPLIIDAATGRGPPLHIFGSDYPTPDGTSERDYIHVSDLARAHVHALQYLQGGNPSVTLNLGTGRGISILSLIAAVEQIIGSKVPVVQTTRRAGDPPTLVADSTRAREVLGFEPRLSDLETIISTARRLR